VRNFQLKGDSFVKRVWILAGVLILLISMGGCNAKSCDSVAYGDWNAGTKNILANQFKGTLPDGVTAQEHIQSIYYKFSHALLGDENFVICVELQTPDEAAFEKYLESCTGKSEAVYSHEELCYYLVQCSNESVADYLDDKLYDGMFYNFEIVLADRNDFTIQTLAAHVWDYYKDDELVDFLQKIVRLESFSEQSA